jgi:hypothetical protein
MMETAESALDACERIAAIGVLVFSLEWMYLRRELHSDRLLAWDVLGLRDGWSTSRAVDLVLRDARLWYLQVIRAAMALAIIFTIGHSTIRLVCLCGIIAIGMIWRMRVPLGYDGSDQMASIIFIVAASSRAIGTPIALSAGVLFIAAQGILSYTSAGWAKVFQPGWRDGSYFRQILTTSSYGTHRAANTFLTNTRVARMATLAVLGLECLFPLVLFLPKSFALGILVAVTAFHVACASLMGLNTFVWCFSATYPAILFARAALGRAGL